MRPSSSTWRSSVSLLPLLFLLVAAWPTQARICLPPVFEGGRRLVFAAVEVGSLDFLLRQHEVCWRRPAEPDERRVFVFGNSGIFGFPQVADDTAVAILNRRFAEEGVDAHLFNLGFVLSYTLKDALILHESLPYHPDAIVYAIMLDDLVHLAPIHYPPLEKFFRENSPEVERFADEAPAGIAEPFDLWRDAQADDVRPFAMWRRLRDAGSLARVAVRNWSRALRQRLFPDMPPERPEIAPRRKYSCKSVLEKYEIMQHDWQEWNPLAYLQQVHERTGVPVLVVSWPASHDPRGACFNLRYSSAELQRYRAWIAAETRKRGLHFVDLQNDFPQDEFIDSVHPTAAGQAVVARLLEPPLRELLSSARP